MLALCVLIMLFGLSSMEDYEDKLDQHLIACHTTDFECFKRQYKSLRDNVLLGNDRLSIPPYEHFIFEYDKGTCVKLAGLEESELVGISMDHHPRKFTMGLQMPLKIQQVNNNIKRCKKPDKEFDKVKPQTGALKRFIGNASVDVSYPFKLIKKKGAIYMKLDDEDLDVILDIPDLSHFDMSSEIEAKLYDWSEWAYDVVQHIDAAKNFAQPYTSQMKNLMDNVPLNKLLLLYPDEDIVNLQFHFDAKQ